MSGLHSYRDPTSNREHHAQDQNTEESGNQYVEGAHRYNFPFGFTNKETSDSAAAPPSAFPACNQCSQFILTNNILNERITSLETNNQLLVAQIDEIQMERKQEQQQHKDQESELNSLRTQNEQMSKQLLQQGEIKKVVQTYD